MTDERDADPSSQQPLNIAARALKKKPENDRAERQREKKKRSSHTAIDAGYISACFLCFSGAVGTFNA